MAGLRRNKGGQSRCYSLTIAIAAIAVVAIVASVVVSQITADTYISISKSILQIDGSASLPVSSAKEYIPATVETYLIENAVKLGYHPIGTKSWSPGCNVWNNATAAPEIHNDLLTFLDELDLYNELIGRIPEITVDNRIRLQHDPNNACDILEPHPQGLLNGIFKKSRQLSWTPKAGYIEPLYPPMRHPRSLCWDPPTKQLLDMSYMIHDYAHLCRQLKPVKVPGLYTEQGDPIIYTPKTVLLDMGAALDFHKSDMQTILPPPIQFYNMWRRYGFYFDHIYAFEMVKKNSTEVFQALSPEYMAAYHWINIGVDSNVTSRANALYNVLLSTFTPEDFVVVKLDIDTSSIELALVNQLINDPRFHNLIDIFYFEHHVKLLEIKPQWRSTVRGHTVKNTLDLFSKLRKLGIPAHYWI